ncbi:hypothetical protein MYSTI_05204 [Myxococcus stipitatus DSM 14675]|uniref:Uncharacterized protein n=1 Tax=Myxococcus stipitatus (strain DSM 14675 / JCM 12634 / Mx s8) TaxID=1278073 RepID=L7UF57_MYXSD|nr:hypothetical protein [Myxococcus stipitatus]AGC46485.1 hypothetical protein MYSTI_05204 [Myxococcus stipitatus DSM 14675]
MKVLEQTSSRLRVRMERPSWLVLALALIATLFVGGVFWEASNPFSTPAPLVFLLVAAFLWFVFLHGCVSTFCTVDRLTGQVKVERRSLRGRFEHVHGTEDIADVIVQVTPARAKGLPMHTLALRLQDEKVFPLRSRPSLASRAVHDEFAALLRGYLSRTRTRAD